MITQRPAVVADRAVPVHWEGDLITGLKKSVIGTLVELRGGGTPWSPSASRYTMLLHLPRIPGFGTIEQVKNGRPLAGHGAEAVRDAVLAQIGDLPDQLRRSLTSD